MSTNGDSLGASFDDYDEVAEIVRDLAMVRVAEGVPCQLCLSHAMPVHEDYCPKARAEAWCRRHVTSP